MKWVAVLLVVALVAIDGLTALNLHAPLGTSRDSGKQRSRSATGLDVGVSKEDGLKLTKTESQEQHSGASNQQNSKTRTASQDGNSQTDLERHRSEDTETNNARQDTQSLSLAGQNGLLQSKETTRRNGDTTKKTQESERVHSTSHDQNGGNSRDVNSLNERGNNHQTQSTYDEQSSSGFGLGNGGLTSSRSGSRSATNSDTDKGFNRNQRTEEETSQQGGTVVHRKSQSGSNEENEQFQQTSSQSGYSDHGQGNRGGGQQGLLNTANHDKPGQYKFKRAVPIRHKPISHIPSHGTFEKFANHQNGNVGSQTGNHGVFNRPIGHLSSHSGGHINGVWNQGQNIEQLLRGAGNQRHNHIVSGSGIKHQGANSADYVNQNDGTDTLKHLTGSEYPGIDLNQDLTEVHNQGRNKVHFVSGSEYQGSDVNEGFNRVLIDDLNTANFGSGSENQGTNSGEYVSGIIADDSGYESVNDDLGQVVNREIHSDQFISGIDNQGANAGQYANKIGAHGNGYQRTDEPGSLSEILRRRLNKPHYISGSGNQGINSGKYVNGIFTPNDKYISGNGYRSNSNEYLNGLLHRGRVNYHPVTASQANVAGKYINRDFGQEGVNTDQYAFVDENEDVNSQYISDILTQAQRLLKHGTVPNGFGTTPIHYRPISSNIGPVYRTPNSGRRFYDQGIGSYMANPSSAADDDSSYGEVAPEYVIPTGIPQGFNSYLNGHISRPSYYRNGGFGTGLGYLPGTDGTAPTTIFGRSPGFNHVSPVTTLPVSHVANEDNAGVLVDKTLKFAPLRPLTPLSPLSPLIPNDNDYEGTSGDAADIIIDTELLSRRNTKAPGTDGLVKKVGITNVINQDFTDKTTHVSHVDSNNSGTSRNINEAIIDKTVLVKHTNKNGQDNGNIDNASTKTTTIIGNNDGSVVNGNGPSKPGKSIVIDKTPVFNKSDKDGKFNDNNGKGVDNKQKSLGKDVGSVVTGKDNEGTTKNDQSIVIDKITGIIKSVKDGKDKGKKDKTVTNIEKVLGTDVKSGPIDNKDNKPTTNGKSIVTDKTTVSKKTDFDGKGDVSNKKYKDVDNTTKPVTSVVIEKTTVINKPLEKDGAPDSNGNTVTTVPSKSSVDKSTDKNSKDKSLENIKSGLRKDDGSDKKDKDIDSNTKRVQTINKILGKVGGSDINDNTVTTATKISSGDKTTDNIPKDDNKKDTTVEKITKVLGKDDEFENNGKHVDKTMKPVKPIIIEKTTVIHKILDIDGGSDTNGYKKIIGTDISLEGKTSISKDDDEKYKTVKKITKVLGKEDRSDKNNKYVYDTRKPVKSIVNEKTSVINQILRKDGESNTNTKLTKSTDKSSEEKYTYKILKDDKKDKTVEKITKVLGKEDRSDKNNKYVYDTRKPVKSIVNEKTSVINQILGKDGESNTNTKLTKSTDKSSEDKYTNKISKDDKKDKTVEKITEVLGKDDRSENNGKHVDKTMKPVEPIIIEKVTVINKILGEGDESDTTSYKKTVVTDKSSEDKTTDKIPKDDDKKDKTVEKIKRVLIKDDGSDNNYKNIDKTTKPVKTNIFEKKTAINKNLGDYEVSDTIGYKKTNGTNKSSEDKTTDKTSKDDNKKDKTIEKIRNGLGKDDRSDNKDKDVDSTKKPVKSVVTEKTSVANKNLGKDVESDKNDKKETIVTEKSLRHKNTDKNSKDDTIEKIKRGLVKGGGSHNNDKDVDSTKKPVKSVVTKKTSVTNKNLGKNVESDKNDKKETIVTDKSLEDKNTDKNSKDDTIEKINKSSSNDDGLEDTDDDDDSDDCADDDSNDEAVKLIGIEETTVNKKPLEKDDGSYSKDNTVTTMTNKSSGDKNTDKTGTKYQKKDKATEKISKASTNDDGLNDTDDNYDGGDDENDAEAVKSIGIEETTGNKKDLGKDDGSDSSENKKITVTNTASMINNSDKENNKKNETVKKYETNVENDENADDDEDDDDDDDVKIDESGEPKVSNKRVTNTKRDGSNEEDKSVDKNKQPQNINEDESNGGNKDESENGDGSGNDDWDDDDVAPVKSGEERKSGTYVGKEGRYSTKTDKVLGQKGQKNDHVTNSKVTGNDGASKDDKLTVSNKTGQDDSNNGKNEVSNGDDDLSFEYCDDYDDEDYLFSEPGRKGDENTTAKSDKDIKSTTDGGNTQKDLTKIGKVAGRKTQKNDHGTNSKDNGNDGVSKDDKLTVIKKKRGSDKAGQVDNNDRKKDESNTDDNTSNGDSDDDEDYLSSQQGKEGDDNTTVKSDKDIKSRIDSGDKQKDLIKIGKVAGQKNDHGTYSKESGNDRTSKDTKVTDIKKKRGSNKTGQNDSNDGKKDESNRNDVSSNGDRDDDDDDEDYLSGKPGRKSDANTTVKSDKDIKSRTDGGDKQKDLTKIGKVAGQKNDHGTYSKESGNDRASKDTKVTDIKKKRGSNRTGQNDSNDGKKDESHRNDDSSTGYRDDDDEDYLSGKPGKKGVANTTVKSDKDIKSRTDGGDKQKDLTKIGKVVAQKNDHGTYPKESGYDRASKDTKVTDIKKKRGSNKTGQNDSNDGKKDESNRNNDSSNGDRDDDDEDYLSGKPGRKSDANKTVKSVKDIKSRTDGGDKQKDLTKIGKVAAQKNDHGTYPKESGNDRASKDTKVTDIKKKRGSNKTGQNDSNDGKKDESHRNDDSSTGYRDDDDEDYLSGKPGKKGDANTTVKSDKDIKSRTDGGDKQKDLTKIGKVAAQKNDHGTYPKESGNDRASKDTKVTDIKKKRGSNKTGQNDSNDGKKDESHRNDDSSTGYRDDDDDEDYLSGKPGKKGDANTTVKSDKDIKSRTDGGDKQKDLTKIGKVVGQKNDHGTYSKESGNDRASKDTKVTDIKNKRGSNKTGQNDSNDGKKDESHRNDDSSTGYRDDDDDEDYLSGKPGKKGDANTTVKSDKDIKSRTDGGDKQKDLTKIGKVAGQKNDHGTYSKETGNDRASKDTKVTDIKKKRGSNKTGQNDSNDGKADGFNSNDDSSHEDCDDDEDYLSGKPGRKSDANTTVKSDKDIKSRTDGGDKQKDLIKIGKVAGQKNDHGTYSKESGNDRASKDTKVTDIKKKHGSNKTGQNDSNDGKKDESNRNDDSSTGYRDDDDDEDYLSGKPGKKGDADTTVKSDKDIKSRTNGGDKQKDIKSGKVAGRKTQKNDHGTDSKESGNDGVSKDDKLTDIKKKHDSNKTGQNDSNDGKADGFNSNDDSSTAGRDDDDNEYDLSDKSGKGEKSGGNDASKNSRKGSKSGRNGHKVLSKIVKDVGRKQQKNDQKTNSYINETDGESRVINKETVSSKTDEVESANVKKVETIKLIKKEVASDNDDNSSNNDRNDDNDDSYDNFGNSAKKDKKAVGSDNRDGTSNQATDNSGKVDKFGINEKKDTTVTNTNTGGSIRHTNETFKTKNRRTINKVGKKDIKKSKKHFKSRHASDSSLEVSHDNNGKNSNDDINTTTRHEHNIRIKTVKALQEKEHKNGDDNSADSKNVGTTSTSTNSKRTITKIPNISKNNSNTSIKNGEHSGRDDKSNKDDNSAVNNEKSKSNRHANVKGNKNKSSKVTRKHTASSNNEEFTDTNISEDKIHSEKHIGSGSKNKPTDDNDGHNESDKHSKHGSTKKSNTHHTIHDLGQKDTASVTDDADSNKSDIGTTSTTETITTSRSTDNAHKNTKSKKRSKTTTDSRESTRTDDGKHQDKNNGGTANDDGSENCGEGKPGGSSTNEKETGTQLNDKTKRNASKKREEQSRQSASGYGSGSEEESFKKKGDKSTYNKKSDDNEHSEQQKDSKFTEVTQGSKGKTVQTGQKSASEKENQSSSDNYTEETDGKNKKSQKESSNSEDKAKKEAASVGSERVYSNGNMGKNKSSSRNKSIKSTQSSFTKEKSRRTS